MLAAAKQNGSALQFAAEELKKDREVVLAAVQQNGNALQYAAEELQKDRELFQIAIPSLITLCEDDSWRTRMDAVKLLGQFADKGDAQAIAEATKHLKDSDGDVRKAAAEALKLLQ